MVDVFVIAYIIYLSNFQLTTGQLPDTESLRNITQCDTKSGLTLTCGTDEVIAIHSIKLAHNSSCETICCNTYDRSDCFADFDAEVTQEIRRRCSGRQRCSVPSIKDTAVFCAFGVQAVSYVFLQYYCIPENRTIAICDTGKTLTSDGSPLFITSEGYPDVTIGSTSCACSIEANSCSSSITIYEADIDLYLDTNNCQQNVVFKNGTDGASTTIGCETFYTEYITSRTINSHYSKIEFINNSTANQEGLFLLGLKASEDGVSFSISCPSLPENWCVGCEPIQNITNGIFELRIKDDTSYGAIADVSCIDGYETNTSTISCQANNTWQDAVCTTKDCGPVPTVNFGNITLNGTTTFGSTATVECITGYEPNKTIITCLASGQWDIPECNLKDCGPAPTVDFGNITLNGTTTFGSTATVECKTGYEPNKTIITCLASGQWETSECNLKDCGPAPTVDFGSITLNGTTTFGSTATVQCKTGYEPNKAIITCLASGQWETPECNLKDCGPAPTVDFGNIIITGTTTFGSTATVECKTGYEPNKTIITCLDSGQWETPECNLKNCGPAPTVDFGNITLNNTTTFGSTATVECITGYEPNKTIITCLASGQWETPECNIKDCGAAPNLDFANITLDGKTTFGSSAKVECKSGYGPNKTIITCLASGQWETPECIIKDCGPVPVLDFGNITLDGTTTFGSSAKVECETGYEPNKTIITCLASGQWETSECNIKVPDCPEGLEVCLQPDGNLTCVQNAVGCCGPVPDIENGHAVIGDNNTIADVVCDEGHNESSSSITCLASGDWEQATCTVVDCGSVPTVDFGNINPDGTTIFGSTATVECDMGYQPKKAKIKCLPSGRWELTQCNIKDCGDVPPVEFGNITLDGTTIFGSSATIECEPGYEPSKPIITCLASGQWETGECIKRVTDATTPSDNTQKSSIDTVLIIIIVIIVVVILIQFSVVTFFQCKIYSIRKRASDEHVEMLKRVMMIIVGSVPLLGIIAIYFSGKVFYTEVYKVSKYTRHTDKTGSGTEDANTDLLDDKSLPMSQLDEKNRTNQLIHEDSEIEEKDKNSVHVDQINIDGPEEKRSSTLTQHEDNAISNPTYASAPNSINDDKANRTSSEIHGNDKNLAHVNDTNLEGTEAKTHINELDYDKSLHQDNAVSNST